MGRPIRTEVIVVPILAPIMTPIDWGRVINPALTSPTTRAVVPDEDWIKTVITIPTNIPLSGEFVDFSMIILSLFPASVLSDVLIKLIP